MAQPDDQPRADQLSVSVLCAGPVTLVKLTGELDILVADEVRDSVTRLAESGRRDIRLDLGELSFLDVRGARALVNVHTVLKRMGGQLTVGGARPVARRLLTVIGYDAMLYLV